MPKTVTMQQLAKHIGDQLRRLSREEKKEVWRQMKFGTKLALEQSRKAKKEKEIQKRASDRPTPTPELLTRKMPMGRCNTLATTTNQ
jgi:hypothetical protein